jgi:hypothetical protein
VDGLSMAWSEAPVLTWLLGAADALRGLQQAAQTEGCQSQLPPCGVLEKVEKKAASVRSSLHKWCVQNRVASEHAAMGCHADIRLRLLALYTGVTGAMPESEGTPCAEAVLQVCNAADLHL